MRKNPDQDGPLYDHIKELWSQYILEEDILLQGIRNFSDLLVGYFYCYYKSELHKVQLALNFFGAEIILWGKEHEDTQDFYEHFD